MIRFLQMLNGASQRQLQYKRTIADKKKFQFAKWQLVALVAPALKNRRKFFGAPVNAPL